MEIRNNILRDINQENNFYFIDLVTGVKVEVFCCDHLNSEILLIRGDIEREDEKRAKSLVDLVPLRSRKNNDDCDEEIIKTIKKMVNQIKEDTEILKRYPKLQSIRFHVGNYKSIRFVR